FDPDTSTWSFDAFEGDRFLNVYFTIRSNAAISNLEARNYDTGFDRAQRPVLISNTAEGLVDRSADAGLTERVHCVSGVAGDFDNDMDLDVYLVCRSGAQNLANILLQNDGGVFTEVEGAGGAAGITGLSVTDEAGNGESVVAFDHDMDGRLDLLVSNGLNLVPQPREGQTFGGGPYQLFENETVGGNWVQFDLVGSGSTNP